MLKKAITKLIVSAKYNLSWKVDFQNLNPNAKTVIGKNELAIEIYELKKMIDLIGSECEKEIRTKILIICNKLINQIKLKINQVSVEFNINENTSASNIMWYLNSFEGINIRLDDDGNNNPFSIYTDENAGWYKLTLKPTWNKLSEENRQLAYLINIMYYLLYSIIL